MHAPDQSRPPIGSADELRLYIAECLFLASLYASHGAELVEIGDNHGLEISLRKLITYTKAAVATHRDLRGRTCIE